MKDKYENPLATRYASEAMIKNFSDDRKFQAWRRLWVALAETEKQLGLSISSEQIDEMKAHIEDIDYAEAEARERVVRHDVMAHVYAYGLQCPKAKPVIHLGATSCYVGDNADILIVRDALNIILLKLVNVIHHLKMFTENHKSLPALGFTHLQPAQLTTVGKRACLWIQDLLMDYRELVHVLDNTKLRGVKGTTGTQASFLTLFDGDSKKVVELERLVAKRLGFDQVYAVTGQTYPRKYDSMVLNLLSDIAQSAYKFSNDMRLLQHLKEMEEPFGKQQIGSSAMAYKRNPMRAERISALSRYVLTLPLNAAVTASTQWFERTLDDSANRRIVIPQAFLAVDAILNIYLNITDGLVLNPRIIEKHIAEELPFMATETILMNAVKMGGDRQALHEKIRQYAMQAAARVKNEGKDNNLIDLIAGDPAFMMTKEALAAIMDPINFIGRCPEQVDDFIASEVAPVLEQYRDKLGMKSKLDV